MIICTIIFGRAAGKEVGNKDKIEVEKDRTFNVGLSPTSVFSGITGYADDRISERDALGCWLKLSTHTPSMNTSRGGRGDRQESTKPVTEPKTTSFAGACASAH